MLAWNLCPELFQIPIILYCDQLQDPKSSILLSCNVWSTLLRNLLHQPSGIKPICTYLLSVNSAFVLDITRT